MIAPRRGGTGVPARSLNRLIARWLRIGLPAPGVWLLVAPGRRTGTEYATPVCVPEVGDAAFLVSPRGETGWVRNVRAAGAAELRKGRRRRPLRAAELSGVDREAAVLLYLDRYGMFTRRLFGTPRRVTAADVRDIADRHPAFRLTGG